MIDFMAKENAAGQGDDFKGVDRYLTTPLYHKWRRVWKKF